MVRLRPKGRTNDIPCNGRPRVTSQRQARHLSLIHLRNRMITNEDNARRTSGLAIFRMLDNNFRRRLRESGFRSRRPLVGPIIKQRHKPARLTWLVHAVVGGFTPGNTSYLVMYPPAWETFYGPMSVRVRSLRWRKPFQFGSHG
jgi:hypothetical protein